MSGEKIYESAASGPSGIAVADTSVLVDLERGESVETCFTLPLTFAVPDVLYERELEARGGGALKDLGLRMETLDSDGVALAARYRRARPALSTPDGFGLALAKIRGWPLLAGDGVLRALAEDEGVECHGMLWLLDWMVDEDVANPLAACAGLERIAAHPRCRLPGAEIDERFHRYRGSPVGPPGGHIGRRETGRKMRARRTRSRGGVARLRARAVWCAATPTGFSSSGALAFRAEGHGFDAREELRFGGAGLAARRAYRETDRYADGRHAGRNRDRNRARRHGRRAMARRQGRLP